MEFERNEIMRTICVWCEKVSTTSHLDIKRMNDMNTSPNEMMFNVERHVRERPQPQVHVRGGAHEDGDGHACNFLSDIKDGDVVMEIDEKANMGLRKVRNTDFFARIKLLFDPDTSPESSDSE
ncbi:hypothetical protein KXW25_002440 [Aspergillus fumigatus]|nr:hypothetical protein KXW25_002440 [Aspergillus fumigatus]